MNYLTLNGGKTYLAGGLMIAYGAIGIVLGLHDTNAGIARMIEGLGLIGIGHKLDKSTSAASP